jgi:arylformamidase
MIVKPLFRNGNCFTLFVVALLVGGLLLASSCSASVLADNALNRLNSYWHRVKPKTPMVEGVRILRDLPYGKDAKQRMDVYAPEHARNAPIIVWLHGGGFEGGDKAERDGYINKVNRWIPKGLIIVSLNTRLVPEADAYDQLHDVALATADIQLHADDWGGDANKLFLMGHSSAGTLVAALTSRPSLVAELGGKPWLGGISLDSSSLDIPNTMSHWHPPFLDRAFGSDRDAWKTASPQDLLDRHSLPQLIVCSIQREDNPCSQAAEFAQTARALGVRVQVLARDLNHGDVNFRLGLDEDYTHMVETFMAQQNSDAASLLACDLQYAGHNAPTPTVDDI